MIKSFGHAIAIQQRRYSSGKRGVAKAVRRFMLNMYRATGLECYAPWSPRKGELYPADFSGCGSFPENHRGAPL